MGSTLASCASSRTELRVRIACADSRCETLRVASVRQPLRVQRASIRADASRSRPNGCVLCADGARCRATGFFVVDVVRRGSGLAKASAEQGQTPAQAAKPLIVLLLAMSVVVLGVINRVANKVALVFLGQHTLFLLTVQTLSYVLVYGATLAWRTKAGIVTRTMLTRPRKRILLIGFLDAIGLALSLSAAASIPGAALPVLACLGYIPATLIFSFVMMKKRYTVPQLQGVVLVILGVVLSTKESLLSLSYLQYTLSYVFPGMTLVLKQLMMQDTEQYGPQGLDMFVINTYASLFQGVVVACLMAITAVSFSRGGGFAYLSEGFGMLKQYIAPAMTYIIINIMYNVQILVLIKNSRYVTEMNPRATIRRFAYCQAHQTKRNSRTHSLTTIVATITMFARMRPLAARCFAPSPTRWWCRCRLRPLRSPFLT